jgi:hypothetical protein
MKKIGLQKFTDEKKFADHLWSQDVITPDDTAMFKTKKGSDYFRAEFHKRLNEFKGEEYDKLLKQIDPILHESSKNALWENHHLQITQFIATYIDEYGAMPNKTKIADGTRLSRNTIHKHFKAYQQLDIYKGQHEQFKIMRDKILAKVYQYATRGDVKACKVFLEFTGGLNNNGTSTQNLTQNNFIQVNNTIIRQENIRDLDEDQLKQIEEIINKKVLITV